MTLPISTATYSIIRPTGGAGGEVFETSEVVVVAGVRGVISKGRGTRTTTAQDTATEGRYVLDLDPFVPAGGLTGQPLQPGDIARDDANGEEFVVEYPHLRALLPHWTCYVIVRVVT